MGPGHDARLGQSADRLAELLRENHELRERLAEAQARLDAMDQAEVYVKPQSMPLADALNALPDARPGDILREAGTFREWVRRGDDGEPRWIERSAGIRPDGIRPAGTLLSTP